MNDDVRKYIYGTIVVFIVGVMSWIGIVYVSACGLTLTCNQGKQLIVRTPIPTVGHAPNPAFVGQDNAEKCKVAAVDLLGAWVEADSPEGDAFGFTDVNGVPCEGNYADDVRPLFLEANIWYSGSYSCASCHSADLAKTSASKLDLTTYAGILAGSQRESAEVSGTDILGGGNWEKSLLYEFTYARPFLPPGHGEIPADGPMVYAGSPAPAAIPTP
jgi:hypothetical protein